MRSALLAVMLIAACGAADGVGAGTPPPTDRTAPARSLSSPSAPVVSQPADGSVDRGDVRDMGVAAIVVGTERLLVAVADTVAERTWGLQEVEDLGDLDGMLFAHEEPVALAFTMRNTLIPLDLALFDGDGRLLEVIEMVPCDADADSCPSYRADAPARWAIEAEAGRFADLATGTVLSID